MLCLEGSLPLLEYTRRPIKERVYVMSKHYESPQSKIHNTVSLNMLTLLFVQTALLALSGTAFAYPSHMSLAGLTREQLDQIVPTLTFTPPPPPPAPLTDTSAKLVNDPAHPWQPLRPGDIRGVCPGLNTLASHGVRQMESLNTIQKLNVFPSSSTFPVME